ncbi:type II secretion system protein E [Clostridium acetireducens DSM 10703]|uniref:Type II secretion system protein E n=1 Tax=Clostridium acetireducens DSM 10703 TaxID=1121290 RepID=A0A1E8F2H0_9CLOT|nr:GspE/PulE family protein [Clostridium acetireducens]OFI07574.1 type II secretion system protein E [Clostridium acetireducens DSM 10703]
MSAQWQTKEFDDLNKISIDIEAVKLIPKKFALKNNLIPVKIDKNKLYVAVKCIDEFALDYIKFITNKDVVAILAKEEFITKSINFYYDRQYVKKALEKLEKENHSISSSFVKEESFNIKEEPAVKFTDIILKQAIYKKASDIHIEPFEDTVWIRFRIDGILYKILKINKDIYNSINTRIKIMANMNIAEKRMPQDGKIRLNINNYNYDFRVSSLPTISGEKIVIRILYDINRKVSLNALGFNYKDIKKLKNFLQKPNGIILITGPTGSGKTTTLYAMLNEINNNSKNITTIEDPVEYVIKGINQVNVNNKIGFTFAKGLRNLLRQDPDILMVGEIRDEETAQIAVRASITGHLVLSTLHTNDTASSILRLIDMGVPDYLLFDSITGIIAQRLVRKICVHCREKYLPDIKEKNALKLNSNTYIYRGKGCSKCNNTGYRGRIVTYELLDFNKFYSSISEKKNVFQKLNTYVNKEDFQSLRNNCIDLVKKGITTYEEAVNVSFN